MLPYLVTVIAISGLFASLHKERVSMPNQWRVVRAIRLHHLLQFGVVLLSLWAAVVADREAKALRETKLDAAVTVAASRHAVPILDLYFLKLLPAASTFKNAASFEAALSGTHIYGQRSLVLERAAPGFARQYEASIAAFTELQHIARTVVAESSVYGHRYPRGLTAWAERTLELKASDLPALTGNTDMGRAYAELTGGSIGFSMGAAREANERVAK